MTDQPKRGSLLARKREQRDERVQDIHLDLPVPSWNGELVIRLKVLEREQIEAFQSSRRSTGGDSSFVAMAATEIYMYDPDKNEPGLRMANPNPDISEPERYVRLEDEHELPIVLDERFVESIGLDTNIYNTPEKVVRYIFADNSLAIGSFLVRAMRWMENTDLEVSSSLVGELMAQGTTRS